MDKQLVKFKTNKDNLYRVRWYAYGSGVASVLEKFNGSEWKEIERLEEGKGNPGDSRVFDDTCNHEELRIIREMKEKVRNVYGEEVEEELEGAEVRKK